MICRRTLLTVDSNCSRPLAGRYSAWTGISRRLAAARALTVSIPKDGWQSHQPDQLPVTLSDMMGKVLTDQPIAPGEGILHHPEGIDLMPSNIALSGMEVSLVNAMSRETILRQYLDTVGQRCSYPPR